MQYVFIILAIVFYIVRFISKQKKEQEEAARRRQQLPPKVPSSQATSAPPSENDQPQPKTIDEILREMHRRVETQNKPFAKPATPQKAIQKTFVKKEIPKPQPKAPEKKEVTPFLKEEYSAYTIEAQKIPLNMAEDFIKQGQLTDIYNEKEKKPRQDLKFNLRDAVVASVVLNRLEW